jgi:hypothetical protein
LIRARVLLLVAALASLPVAIAARTSPAWQDGPLAGTEHAVIAARDLLLGQAAHASESTTLVLVGAAFLLVVRIARRTSRPSRRLSTKALAIRTAATEVSAGRTFERRTANA